jgi:hypothetical protein
VLGQAEVDQLIAFDRDRQIHGAEAGSPPFVLTQRGKVPSSRNGA